MQIDPPPQFSIVGYVSSSFRQREPECIGQRNEMILDLDSVFALYWWKMSPLPYEVGIAGGYS